MKNSKHLLKTNINYQEIMMIKKILAKVDIEFFKKFKERYEGWDIVRYEDNSLVMIPPKREPIVRKRRWP